MCIKGMERKRRQQVDEEVQASAPVSFQAYGRPLEALSSFKYLWRVLTASDDNCPELIFNLSRSWWKWARKSRILVQEGEDARTSGNFYKAVIQVTLLFVSEAWVITSRIRWNLGGFHHRGVYRLVGIQPQRESGGL